MLYLRKRVADEGACRRFPRKFGMIHSPRFFLQSVLGAYEIDHDERVAILDLALISDKPGQKAIPPGLIDLDNSVAQETLRDGQVR